MKVRNAKLLALLLLVFALGSVQKASATQLDLGSLASFDYAGSDSLNANSSCRLVVSPIRPDFGGRMIQDYRLWTENRADLNFNIRLKGPNRIREGSAIDGNRVQFDIALDGYILSLISDNKSPANILEFKFFDNSGVSGNAILMMNCQRVQATPR